MFFFSTFWVFFEVSGVDDKIARAILFACVFSSLVGFFMDYEGQSDRDSERERGEERDNDVDTKSVKFILQYALYVRAINNKERVDNNAQIERGGKEKDREREG